MYISIFMFAYLHVSLYPIVFLDSVPSTDIVENLLYVLWSHLQFYLVYCKPIDPDSDLGVPGMAGMTGMRRMQGRKSLMYFVS